MIKTSVIIPVYNTGIYIEECIECVFHQTQKEIEVIAINDGSTDDSLDILLRMQKKYPELIILSQENNGLGYARNVGISRARGEYIYFLDSDDYILENTLEKCYECASENKLDLVLFDAFEFEESVERRPIVPNYSDRHNIIEERGQIFSGINFLEKYCQKAYAPEACFMYCSTNFLRMHNINFLTGLFFEDNEFYCKVMILAERVMYIPEMFYQYRCRKDSITGEIFNLRKAKDHIEVIRAMSGLRILKEGKGWNAVRSISLNLLRYVAGECRNNRLYDKDSKLSEQILGAWSQICGKTIENIQSLEDVEDINKLCSYLPDSVISEKKRLTDSKRKQLLILAMNRLTCKQKGIEIAIYGCGKYTEKVLGFYEEKVSSIEANIIFLDSYIKDCGNKYRGCPLVPISEIGERKLDYIFISSPRYEKEMDEAVRRLYGDKFIIISLYGDLHINI